jgi:hypothetical protein
VDRPEKLSDLLGSEAETIRNYCMEWSETMKKQVQNYVWTDRKSPLDLVNQGRNLPEEQHCSRVSYRLNPRRFGNPQVNFPEAPVRTAEEVSFPGIRTNALTFQT